MLEVSCPRCRKRLLVVETATDRDSQCPACREVFKPDGVLQAPPPRGPAARDEAARFPTESWLNPWADDRAALHFPAAGPTPPDPQWLAVKRALGIGFVLGVLVGAVAAVVLSKRHGELIDYVVQIPVLGAYVAIIVGGYSWLLAQQNPDWPRWPTYATWVTLAGLSGLLLYLLLANPHRSTSGDLYLALTASASVTFVVFLVLRVVAQVLAALNDPAEKRPPETERESSHG